MWRPGNWSSSAPSPPPQGGVTRPYSPSPLGRRPTSTARPVVSGLMLSASPNASTVSLPSMVRTQQTLGYRQVLNQPPPNGARDPMVVLEGILGVRLDIITHPSSELPDVEEADNVDFAGLSLGDYVDSKPRRRAPIEKSAEEYEEEKEKFLDLHKSIKACDEVLQSVESYLSAFKTDLGTVSAEIESLQNRSTSLNQKLDNRKNVEKLLGPTVEDVVLPPNDVRRLVEGDVNDSWVKALHETERRMKAIEAMDADKIKAVREVQPEFERITHKVIERVRDFFVSRIKAMRFPGANIQAVQQSGFLRYKELFNFIANHHPQLGEEIGQAYINTTRWYYHTNFQRYHKALEKAKLHIVDKGDALGQEEQTKKGIMIPSLKAAAPTAYDSFNIGRRIDILRNRTLPPVTAAQIEEDKSAHYAEYPFRHLNVALIENASAEYTFISEFFSHKKYDQISHIFTQIFDQTFTLGQTFTKSLIDPTFDCLGILICVRLNQDATFEMQKRRIPTAEGYLNATNMLLWPRFQIVMNTHCESLRRFITTYKSSSTAAAKQSAAPHPLTQRFASLLHGLLLLSAESGDDEPVANSLGRLRSEYEALMTKLATTIVDSRKRERFLFNNYSLILTIIGDTDGKLAVEQKSHFETLKMAFRE